MSDPHEVPRSNFDEWYQGNSCPLCAPRPAEDSFREKIAQLHVSTLYLERDQRHRGYCLLIFDPRHVTGLEALGSEEYEAFGRDLRNAARAVTQVCKPDLMNYSSLGNVVPHLHWHLVPRYKTDVRWGRPIYWGWASRKEYDDAAVTLPTPERAQFICQIRDQLAAQESEVSNP